jgi:hypothetical protein
MKVQLHKVSCYPFTLKVEPTHSNMALADRTRAKVMHYGEHICARTTGVNRGHVDKRGRQQKHRRKIIPNAVFDRQRKDGCRQPQTTKRKTKGLTLRNTVR